MAETIGSTVWLTGMSGAGKTTLAHYLGNRLRAAGRRVEILDEEEVRERLSVGTGATREERETFIRRIGWVASVLTRNDVVAVVAATSPYRETRDAVRRDIGRFTEVFCDCPVETLIERDVKGLYKKALAGEIPNFTGITEPYEPPVSPEVVVDSGNEAVEVSSQRIIESMRRSVYLAADEAQVALYGRGKAAAKAAKPRKTTGKEKARPAAAAAKKPAATARKAAGTTSKKAPAKRTATRTRTVSRPARRAAKVATRRPAGKAAKGSRKK